MKTRHTQDRIKWSMTAGIFMGLMVFLVIAMVGMAVVTSLLMSETLSMETGKYVLYLVLFLSVFLGCVAAAKSIGEKRLLVSGIVAAAVMFIIIGTNFLFFEGKLYGLWLTVLVVILGSVLACVVSAQERQKNLRHKKSRSR